jgi:mono/diheme cytochrome c family protein
MMRDLFAALAVIGALAIPPAAAQQPQHPDPFPPGEGRGIVAVACTQCHAPSAFIDLREDADAWRYQVYDMILRGAQVGPDDLDTVVHYLAVNFGPGVNVPPATREVTLPDGAGKDLVEKKCVLCHGLDRVAAVNRSPVGWHDLMKRMEFYGAPVSGTDERTITAYLGSKFGADPRR